MSRIFSAKLNQSLVDGQGSAATHDRPTAAYYVHPTTQLITEAAIDEERYEKVGEDVYLLHEGQSTNHIIYSRDFSAGFWLKSSYVDITAGQPDLYGSNDATLLAETTDVVNRYHSMGDNEQLKYLPDNVDAVFSLDAKAVEGLTSRRLQICIRTKANSYKCVKYDLLNGEIGGVDSGVTAWMDTLGDGWYRLHHRYSTQSGATTLKWYLQSDNGSTALYQGDGRDLFYIDNAQLEVSSSPTSRMPTAGWTEVDDETGVTEYRAVAVDGSAAIRTVGLDLTVYADGDHLLRLHDSAGKIADGWLSAPGSAEALGSELLSNGTMESGDPPDNWTAASSATLSQQAGGEAGNCLLIARNGVANPNAYQDKAVTTGKLYKVRLNAKQKEEATVRAVLDAVAMDSWEAPADWSTPKTYYRVAADTSFRVTLQVITDNATDGAYFDEVSLKEVTALGTDSALIVNNRQGSTRNWSRIDSGFNWNDISTMEVLSPVSGSIVSRATEQDYPQWVLSAAMQAALGSGGEGTLILEWIPLFDAADVGSSNYGIISCYSGRYSLFYIYQDDLKSHDGTNTVSSLALGYERGDIILLAVRWGSDAKFNHGYSINGGEWTWASEQAYDGAFTMTGNKLGIGIGNEYPFLIRNIRMWDKKYSQDQIENETIEDVGLLLKYHHFYV